MIINLFYNISHIKLIRETTKALGLCLICASTYTTSLADPNILPVADLSSASLPISNLERAQQMLETDNFTGAVDQIRMLNLQNTGLSRNSLTDSEQCQAEYIYFISSLAQRNEPAVRELKILATENSTSTTAIQARLAIGDYYFFNSLYAEALGEYSKINIQGLGNPFNKLYTYRKAVALLKCGHSAEAKSLFTYLISSKDFGNQALYYDAYIDYLEGDYNEAYCKFEKVNPDLPAPQYGRGEANIKEGQSANKKTRNNMPRRGVGYRSDGIEPGYYMAQIEYARGDYKDVINHGKSLLQKRPVEELIPETNKIIGLSYFKLGQYSNAASFLTQYLQSAGESASDDVRYATGVISYHNKDYTSAVQYFVPLIEKRNVIAQSAAYYTGQCAAATGDYNAAAMAFEKACRVAFDNKITEASRYNLITSRMRGGTIPFSSCVSQLETFIQDYPTSDFSANANEIIAEAYYAEKNFTKALEAIERIKNPNEKIRSERQILLYEAGVQLLTSGQTEDAAKYLRQAAENSQPDQTLARQADIWLGDALYSIGEYTEATKAYKKAISGLKNSPNRTLSIYNLAYCLYMANDYNAAEKEFASSLKATPQLPATLQADALIRRGDCLYYTKKYAEAQTLYSQAKKLGTDGADYAEFRQALIDGITGDNTLKLQRLGNFATNYPDSPWIADALLEQGLTYVATDDFGKATDTFNKLIVLFPTKSQSRQGQLILANIHTALGDAERSQQALKDIITKWPTSEEAIVANNELCAIFARQNKLDEYSEFLATIPNAPRISKDEQEKILFTTASDALAENMGNTDLMESYIECYPNGQYIGEALLDLGRAAFNSANYQEAIRRLEPIASGRPDSPESTEALLLLAKSYQNITPPDTAKALTIWHTLEHKAPNELLPEIYVAIMRNETNTDTQLQYAVKVEQSPAVSPVVQEEATYCKARAFYNSGQKNTAIELYTELSKNPSSLSGAQATVSLAEHLLTDKKYDDVEKLLLSFVNSGTPHDYWLARGFIVLADLYHVQNKKHIAMEYLNSLKENYISTDDDIHSMINLRLKKWN